MGSLQFKAALLIVFHVTQGGELLLTPNAQVVLPPPFCPKQSSNIAQTHGNIEYEQNKSALPKLDKV